MEALAKQGYVSVCVCVFGCLLFNVCERISERVWWSNYNVVSSRCKDMFFAFVFVIGGLIHIKIPVVLFDDRAATDQQDQQARKSSRQLVVYLVPVV